VHLILLILGASVEGVNQLIRARREFISLKLV